jgi:heavy metal translocating P-type ATPase
MNLDGFVRMKVTRPASESFVSQVVNLMRQIEERKPPIQLLMDKLMNYYGPVVYVVAVLAFIGWLFYSGSISQAILIGLTTIIMGYPCALGITTPMVLAIGGGHGIARGLLVRAGEFFQALAEVDMVVFDKTGTLTYGRPTVREVVSFGRDERDVLGIIAAAEAGSEHPLAGAIVRYSEFQDISIPEASDFRAVPGKGIMANVNGKSVIVGRLSLLEAEGVHLNGNRPARITELEAGHTVVYAAMDGKPLGAVALQDMPRPGAAAVMKRLHEICVRTAMLTGDSLSVAEAVARDIGVEEVYAELLPEDKVAVIERLQTEGRKVAMVGDGINDAPALVQSDVGIALGAGTDVAMESAGVVLVSDKLDKVVSSVLLGRASHRKMKQNIVIAVVSNIVGMTLAILGLITAPIAIALITVSIFSVLLSTLSLMRLNLGSSEADDAQELTETIIPARKIHCEACSRKIIKNLSPLPGVRKVVPDVSRKEVLVAYEPSRVSDEQLRGQLEQLGFR